MLPASGSHTSVNFPNIYRHFTGKHFSHIFKISFSVRFLLFCVERKNQNRQLSFLWNFIRFILHHSTFFISRIFYTFIQSINSYSVCFLYTNLQFFMLASQNKLPPYHGWASFGYRHGWIRMKKPTWSLSMEVLGLHIPLGAATWSCKLAGR